MSDRAPDWLNFVTDGGLFQLANGLGGDYMQERALYTFVLDELWKRHSTSVEEWPIVDLNPLKESKRLHSLLFYRYCQRASGPFDPDHRPTASMKFPKYKGMAVTCSCGVRDYDDGCRYEIAFFYKSSAEVWWTTVVNGGVKYYEICPESPLAESPEHAPMWAEESFGDAPAHLIKCTCRRNYFIGGYHNEEGRNVPHAKLVPVP